MQVQNPSVTGPFAQLVTVLGHRPSGPQTPPVYGSQQGTIAVVVVVTSGRVVVMTGGCVVVVVLGADLATVVVVGSEVVVVVEWLATLVPHAPRPIATRAMAPKRTALMIPFLVEGSRSGSTVDVSAA